MTTPTQMARQALLAFTLGGGCWVNDHAVSNAIWSDDDQMFAITVNYNEVRASDQDETSSDARTRNDQSQIYIMPSDLSEEPIPLTERRAAGPGVYLMSDAGYLLARWAYNGHAEAHQYFLSENSRMIVDSRKIVDTRDLPRLTSEGSSRLEVIPSPSGDYLAIHQIEGGAELQGALEIVDAFSLESVLPRRDTPAGRIIWNPAGNLVYLSDELGGALTWVPGTSALVAIEQPPCRWPPTTSGPVSEDGRIVGPGEDLDNPVIFDERTPDNVGHPLVPFGCP